MTDRVAVVTGASRGVGKGIAQALGGAGYVVYVSGRSSGVPTDPVGGTIEETAAAVTAHGGQGVAIACDHTDDAQVQSLFERVEAEHGRLDLLVNNVFAGPYDIAPDVPFWERPLSDWEVSIDVALRAHFVASVFSGPEHGPAGLGHYRQHLELRLP